ncbi:Type 1 glutamine amidotransferase-like domain-containing protein [Embleya sp. NBC_00896]|uniref:Type 1 glutamine amidotransferase-like domain-containing protein n=1 Tax=Embleya sp. NBC_00896 TaxID=2975961 RepID=UPI002F91801B|nr:peptidase E [Embleya sp. NBC_00896]
MRMYLSSFRIGDHPDRLLDLLGAAGPGEIAVVADAMDGQSATERAAGVEREVGALRALGLRPSEVDLRAFFDRPPGEVGAVLARFPAVWLRGGNVFMLRYALARSGADVALTDLLRRDALVYAGYSAGACVLAPSLRGLERCDDPDVVPETYGDPTPWAGLGILDHAVVPHVDSPEHPESAALDLVAAGYRAAGTAHRTLRDGQVLVVDGAEAAVH